MTMRHHTAFNPWRTLDRFFDAKPSRPSWAPAFDISENDSEFVLRGDLPGVSQGDIEVRVEDNILTVRAERKPADSEAEYRYSLVERPSGKFRRTFILPENVDYDSIKATFEDGVIELVLSKQELVDTSRLIPVN